MQIDITKPAQFVYCGQILCDLTNFANESANLTINRNSGEVRFLVKLPFSFFMLV